MMGTKVRDLEFTGRWWDVVGGVGLWLTGSSFVSFRL